VCVRVCVCAHVFLYSRLPGVEDDPVSGLSLSAMCDALCDALYRILSSSLGY
jgi:hypothetical protein